MALKTVHGWRSRTMVDRDGDRIGTIDGIYADDQTGQPEWALVNTGLFGTKSRRCCAGGGHLPLLG